MSRPFQVNQIGTALWPEVAGVFGLIAFLTGSRLVDSALKLTKPFRRTQDYAHLLVLGGSGYLVASDRMPDVSKTVLLTDAALITDAGGDWAFAKLEPKVTGKLVRNRRKRDPDYGGGPAQSGALALTSGGGPAPAFMEPSLVGAGTGMEF